MKVEIWSDVMCPFCYIGKRRFEKALAAFPARDQVQVEWKSFQLAPGLKTEKGQSLDQYLAVSKGWSLEQARQANEQVTAMAAGEGLSYHLDKAIVANSFDAHRLIQLGKAYNRGSDVEEALFHAYFTEGKDIADANTLQQLGVAAGLPETAVADLLQSNAYAEAVEKDIYESRQIGVKGVPFFVLNDKYAVTGAQAAETFAGALNRAFSEWEKERDNPAVAG
ncbi:MAG: DsbA family oxidoreductase [Chitinophagaceae bacterium]|nr:DsbA family oxidoreductase [Chitinophagaceae bacterium]